MYIRFNNICNKFSILHNITLHCVIFARLKLVFVFYITQFLDKNYIKIANILNSNNIFIKPTKWYLLTIFKSLSFYRFKILSLFYFIIFK